jgi:FkbM family methyltransferase
MLRTAKSVLRHIVRPRLHRPDLRCIYEVLGTEYGGWPVVDGTVSRDSIVYSFGVGEDVSFDCALISKCGCQVWAFDPTPKSQAWVSGRSLPREFHFAPVGVSATDGEVTFYPPANSEYVSYSVAPSRDQTREPIVAPVRRLSTLMAENGHSHIDVLKMDIEGFEYGVIEDLLAGTTRPQHLLVEFHHGLYGIGREKTVKAVAALRHAGYRLFYLSVTGREYGFFLARPEAYRWYHLLLKAVDA